MKSVRSAMRCALLATGAAGVLAVPATATVLAQSPMEAYAASVDLEAGVEPPTAVVERTAAVRAEAVTATDDAVRGQMATAATQVAAEQAAAAALAAQVAAEQAAQVRAAEEAAASGRASRSRRSELPPVTLPAAGDPRAVALAMLQASGQADQFGCLDKLWTKESGWSTTADNPSSSAYGIPQALPGSKMASAGADWATSAQTQITWGLTYIEGRYGSPCAAWSHSQSLDWY